jgi:hypothetical protein
MTLKLGENRNTVGSTAPAEDAEDTVRNHWTLSILMRRIRW